MEIGVHMHIPDGFLDPVWIAGTYVASLGYIVFAGKRGKLTSDVGRISGLVGVVGAAIFVAQMLNWPLPGGTSLHFVGGALAAILLGPYIGCLTMAAVVTVQCLVFHDGGITALGANLLNMAVIAPLVGYTVFKASLAALKNRKGGVLISGILAGWVSIFLAGVAAGIEIGLSPAFPLGVTLTVPVMGAWHGVLGIIEGLITGGAASYIATKAPDLWLWGDQK